MWSTKRWPTSVYIHWPFCSNRCHFCDFVAFEGHARYEEPYHDALLCEIEAFAHQLGAAQHAPLRSLFLGGGTPSLYPLPLLKELFGRLKRHWSFDDDAEVTIEVNPSGVTHDHLRAWKACGINRLSIGVQVLDDAVLYNLNRQQRADDVYSLLEKAPLYFENISVDLILGLPGVSDDVWQKTIFYAAEHQFIRHISVYFLTIHRKTQLAFRLQKGELVIPEDQTYVTEYENVITFLQQNGFAQYEISNFAKPGYVSRHNSAYWNRVPYKGFGIGASSFDGETRYTNVKNLSAYLKELNVQNEPMALGVVGYRERLSASQQLMEELMLGLRQCKGVDLQRMVYSLKAVQKSHFLQQLTCMKQRGFIKQEKGKVFLTIRGMALENEIVLHLLSRGSE